MSSVTYTLNLLATVVSILLASSGVYGYGKGAPVTQCDDMRPGHYGATYRSAKQTSPPFVINASHYVYGHYKSPNITVRISASLTPATLFKGFMLQARDDNDTNVGTFALHPDSHLQLLACGGINDTAVTHTEAFSKDGGQEAEVIWIAPKNPSGNVTFVATVVERVNMVYMDVSSQQVVFADSGAHVPSFRGLCVLVGFLLSVVLLLL